MEGPGAPHTQAPALLSLPWALHTGHTGRAALLGWTGPGAPLCPCGPARGGDSAAGVRGFPASGPDPLAGWALDNLF